MESAFFHVMQINFKMTTFCSLINKKKKNQNIYLIK